MTGTRNGSSIQRVLFALALIAVSALSGCATAGTKFTLAEKDFPRQDPKLARIYFYRTDWMGRALKPDIHLNDQVIGESVSGTSFFKDVPPGQYTVETHTEASNEVQLLLVAGDVRYVRIDINMGFFVGHPKPKLVPASTAESEIQDTRYLAQVPEGADSRAPAADSQ